MRFASYATLALSFLSAAVAIPATKRNSGDITSALATVTASVTTFDSLVTGFPLIGGSVLGVVGVEAALVDIDVDVLAVIALVGTTPFGVADSAAILVSVKALDVKIKVALNDLITKHGILVGIIADVSVGPDLVKLKADFAVLEAALLVVVDASVVADITGVFVDITASLNAAVGVFV